ncbi:ROK family transcriptional regulator [Isoptericola cucumis]|uniref:ROK family transcriptional regulator n=1 Tax=Isoptericola cucumis TaxID=1776856 RepID=UPI00320B33BF
MAGTPIDDQVRGTVRLRLLNTRRVLTALRKAGRPLRIAELAQMTALTRPTVAQIVTTLEGRDYLRRHEPTETAGRPAARYGLAHDRFVVFGADAGAHRAVVEIASLDGAVRARRERRDTPPLGDRMLQMLGEMVRECLDEVGLSSGALVAGTVASPGIVHEPTGRITLRPGLGDWNAAQVVAALGEDVGGAVTVENDANLAAQAMCTVPGMPQTFFGLQWGQRLGAGIVLDGRVYRGRFGAAGELGSILLTDPVTGHVRHLEEVVRADRLPRLGGDPRVSTEELVAAADAGDRRSAHVLQQGVDPLASAVAAICVVLDLHTVTISGAIARSGPALVAAFQKRLEAHGAIDVECRLSPFHEDTVLRGAVGNAVDAGWEWLLETCGPLASTPGTAARTGDL